MGVFGLGFDSFNIIFTIMFVLVVGFFIFTFVRMIGQKRADDRSPRLTVPVTVVAKRTNVAVHDHVHEEMHHHTTSTTYYATFQVQSGDRMELRVPAEEYGLLVEGDEGDLTFQGSRFLSFERRWGA